MAKKRPAAQNKARDWVSALTGVFLFLYQAITWHISAILVGAALLLMGTPGAIGLIQWARGSEETPDTPSQQSQHQEHSSQ